MTKRRSLRSEAIPNPLFVMSNCISFDAIVRLLSSMKIYLSMQRHTSSSISKQVSNSNELVCTCSREEATHPTVARLLMQYSGSTQGACRLTNDAASIAQFCS